MSANEFQLRDGQTLKIQEGRAEDAGEVLTYLEEVSSQTDFLTFGPGEFDLTELEERDLLREWSDSDFHLYLLGRVGNRIVSNLTFTSGRRPRIKHAGEFGITVQKPFWGLGSVHG